MSCQSRLPRGFAEPHALSGLPASTPILVGFSGGADSTALLNMLVTYGKENGATIYAAHVNHGIRGKEADRDEEFCKTVAQSLGVEIFSTRIDVPALSERSGESIETAARRARYDFFDRIMKEHGIPLLATAHNANDNLETMIFNMARGTALGGMCGIPQTRLCAYGTVIRPILQLSRADILEFCRQESLEYVTDSTNTDTDYTRNKIRAQMIPLLCEINSGAIENSARLAQTLRADALCLESMKDMFLEGFLDGNSIELEKINGSPDAIVNRALCSVYRDVSNGGTLESSHIEALRKLSRTAVPHSSASLPNGFRATVEDGRLVFEKATPKKEYEPYSLPLVEGKNRISQTGCEIVISNSQNTKNIYKNSILVSIDSAKICGSLYARGRQSGDKILSGGMHKSVKKLMCDKKIPTDLRGRLPVICDDVGIVAIPLVAVRDGVSPSKTAENKTELIFACIE